MLTRIEERDQWMGNGIDEDVMNYSSYGWFIIGNVTEIERMVGAIIHYAL